MKKILQHTCLAILLLLLAPAISFGQLKGKAKKDSCVLADDTCTIKKLTLPEKLERFAVRGTLISKLLRSVMVLDHKTQPKDTTVLSPKKFNSFENKRISEIEITVLGPFGYSVTQKFSHPINKLQQLGNYAHYSTRLWIVEDKLLFEKGDKVNAVKIAESERLIRLAPFIVDAKITVMPKNGSNDSVVIYVTVQDVFDLSAGMSGDPRIPNGSLGVTDINFLGLGHRLYNEIWFDPKYTQHFKYNGSYTVPQIANTYISGEVHYNTINDDRIIGFSFNRPFFTPTSKWAGGLNVEFYHSAYSIVPLPDTTTYTGIHNYNTKDLWIGYAFPVNQKISNDITINSQLFFSGKIFSTTYENQKLNTDNINNLFQNEQLYLAGIGIAHREYYKDHYIFAFGKTEDIPLGYLFTLTGGPDIFQQYSRLYGGIKASYGWNNSSLGYMYMSAESGGYLNGQKLEQGVINLQLFYFTNLLNIDKWQFRQYLMNKYTLGYNRKPGEFININGTSGLARFSSGTLTGTRRWINNYEADFFSPWAPLGFKMVFVFYMDDALLSAQEKSIFQSRLYQGFGLAIRFKNEHFIFNTFELSFRLFPAGKEVGGNSYQFYSTGGSNHQFQDFQYAEPYTVPFL